MDTIPKPKYLVLKAIIIISSLIFFIVMVIAGITSNNSNENVKPLSNYDKRKNDEDFKFKIRYQIEMVIKNAMNNPDSYEFVAIQLIGATDNELTYIIKYRGTNAFGGIVTQYVTGVVNNDGELKNISTN